MASKVCTKCKESKSLDEFHRHSGNLSDGRRGQCKSCVKAILKRLRQTDEHKLKMKEKHLKDKYNMSLEDLKKNTICRN